MGLGSVRVLLADWASRGVLALLFVFGLLALAGPPPGASRSESVIEGGSEEFRSSVPTSARTVAKRRAQIGGAPPVEQGETPRAPRVLVLALGLEPPRPRWQVPRRVVPAADDDDDELG